MYLSPLLYVYTYNPETGVIDLNPEQRLEASPRFGTLGAYSSNIWRLRYRGAYIPAAEVAWLHCYQVMPKGRLYLLNRTPSDVRRSNLVVGELPDVNALRRRLQYAALNRKPVDLAAWAKEEGVLLEPKHRTREQFDADREHWAKERAHCAGLGIPCPAFKAWPWEGDYDLDPLG